MRIALRRWLLFRLCSSGVTAPAASDRQYNPNSRAYAAIDIDQDHRAADGINRIDRECDCDGNVSDASQQDLTSKVTWSSDESIAGISPSGVIHPNSMGQTVVSASSGQVTGTTTLTVVSTPKFAFVTGSTSDTISIFSVDAKTSALTNLGTKALAAGSGPLHVALHPTLPILYVLDGSSAKIEAFSIGTDGSLTALAGSPYLLDAPRFAGPSAIAVDPKGGLLYVAGPGTPRFGPCIEAIHLDFQTGVLTDPGRNISQADPAFVAPSAIAVHPSGTQSSAPGFLYVTNANQNSVSSYFTDLSGILGYLPMNSGDGAAPTATNPVSIAVHPRGILVYVGGDNGIYAYLVNPNHVLVPVQGSPFFTDRKVHSLALDATAKHIYFANAVDNSVAAATINGSGALAEITGSPWPAGNGVTSVLVDPSSQFVYANAAGDSAFLGYIIDAQTGALTAAGSVSTHATGAGDLVVSH